MRLRRPDASWVSFWAARVSSQSAGSLRPGSSFSSRARWPGRSKVLLELLDALEQVFGALEQLDV
jgi:hypothetical protein